MDGRRKKPEAAETQAFVLEGTKAMRYWEFRKEFCKKAGWDLRRIAPQTYEVLDNKGAKIGIFKSGEGLFAPQALQTTLTGES